MSMSLGRSIRMVRNLRNVKQQELADSSGLNVSYISMLEADRKNPTWDTLQRIAHALDVSVTLFAILAEGDNPVLAPYLPLVYSAMLQGKPLLKREED